MADTTDRYGAWRENLRTTLKWYVGALVSLGTLLAGSLSFSILPDLQDGDRYFAAVLGAISIALILRGVWLVHKALTILPFPRSQLKSEAVRKRLAPFLDTLLPAGDLTGLEGDDLERLDGLLQSRDDLLATKPVDKAALKTAEARISKITSFASYQQLEADIDVLNSRLMGLFIAAAVSVGYLTLFWSDHKGPEKAEAQPLSFSPGRAGWSAYAQSLYESCGSGGRENFAATGTPNAPFDGWWTITLEGPECKGLTLAVPNAVVQASSSASQ